VLVSVTGDNCFGSGNPFSGQYQIKGFKLATATSGFAVQVLGGRGSVDMYQFELAACASGGLLGSWGAEITLNANWSITGNSGGAILWASGAGARIRKNANHTCTLSGTPSFTTFAMSEELAEVKANGITFSGSGTGVRYSATTNALIQTGGGGANFFPGNSSGTTVTGGQYV
jgi:hypothetical protein